MKKLGFFFGFVFLLTTFSWGQSEHDTICGRWVKDPDYPPGTITHFSIRKRGNGYEVYRTKEPAQKWSGMWDEISGHYLVIVDGLLLGLTYDKEKDRVLVFEERSKDPLFEMKRDLVKEEE
jgi:hypothetical protein